jgi:ParB-like chromosome segregation protein Spo0J
LSLVPRNPRIKGPTLEKSAGIGKEAAVRHRQKQRHEAGRLAITYQPIAGLKLDARNPRVHTPAQIKQIAHSIKTFGFIVPVLIDARGRVIAGHGRVLASQLLGLTEVPSVCVDHLSEVQRQAFVIADNRLTETS